VKDETFVAHIPKLFEKLIHLDLLFHKDQNATFLVPFLNDHYKFVELFVIIFENFNPLLDS